MPIYEYRCCNCGSEFEEWQKITDSPLETCKSCGGKASRLISRSSFVLKGTGWYVTDYGRGGGSCCQSGGSSPSSSSASSSSSDGSASSDGASSASDSSSSTSD